MGEKQSEMENLVMDLSFWRKKRVLVTGHTGFKGSWLCHWLLNEGADVTGYALAPNTSPSLFQLLNLSSIMHDNEGDIRDFTQLSKIVCQAQPEIIFHLAAQPLVRRSYREPRETWETNVLGTIHVMEAAKACTSVRACVVVTSDKCYENKEWLWGYRENEALGGHDPYSASKAATELAVASWRKSFPNGVRLATARAGNVIGGGDWSEDRIVTDFVRAILAHQTLQLRNPFATRPWQHVLEPLIGYLSLAQKLCGNDGDKFAEAWNFGPKDESVITVETLANSLVSEWGSGSVAREKEHNQLHEAGYLKLDSSKAALHLGWHGRWGVNEMVRRTAHWYRAWSQGANVGDLVNADIDAYKQAKY